MKKMFLKSIFLMAFLSLANVAQSTEKTFSENAYKFAFDNTVEEFNKEYSREYRLTKDPGTGWTLSASFFLNPTTGNWISNISIFLNQSVIFLEKPKSFRFYVYKKIGNYPQLKANIIWIDVLPEEDNVLKFSVNVELDRRDLQLMKKEETVFEMGNTGKFNFYVDKGHINGFLDKIMSYPHNSQLSIP